MPRVPSLLPTLVLLLALVSRSKGRISTTPLSKMFRLMTSASTLPDEAPTAFLPIPDVSNPLGNFFVRFSLNLGPNITSACISKAMEGCIGILPSVNKAFAMIVYRKTPYRLLLQNEMVRYLYISTWDSLNNDSEQRSILAAGSMAVIESEIKGVIYLNFSVLVDVIDVAIGSRGLDAALEEVAVTVITAVDEAVGDLSLIKVFTNEMKKYDDANGSPDYHERFWKAQASAVGQEDGFDTTEFDLVEVSTSDDTFELFQLYGELRIVGVIMLIGTLILGVLFTVKGNCYNNITKDGLSSVGNTTDTYVHEDCTSNGKRHLSLTEQGIEEVLSLSKSKLTDCSNDDE